METQWKSKQLHEHPAKHQRSTCGIIELSKAGVYVLKVGGGRMSCPQDWAAKIHKAEQDAEYYDRKAAAAESNQVIFSDDPEAVPCGDS